MNMKQKQPSFDHMIATPANHLQHYL